MLTPNGLSQLAVQDPQAAYALLFGRSPDKQPQVYSLDVTFVTGAAGEHLEAKIDPQFCSDFLIVEARYQVRVNPDRFNAVTLAGADLSARVQTRVQSAGSALEVAKNPFVDVLFTSQGGYTCPKYFFSTKPVPIELLCKHADTVTSSWGCFPFGFIAGATSTIKGDFYLRRNLFVNTPEEGGSEVPYQVSVSFIGMDLGCNRLEIDMMRAVRALQAAKILPEDFEIPR